MWGTFITLRTDARSNLREALFNANTYIHILLSFQLLKAHCSMARQPTLGCHSSLFFFFFFYWPSLTSNETTMSRFCSKDDQKSVVSLTRYYSTQHSKPAHTGASRGLLYCIVHSHAHVRLPLQHSGAIFFLFFFFPTTLQVCRVQDGGAK